MPSAGLVRTWTALHSWWERSIVARAAAKVGGQARLQVIALLACVLGLQSADNATVGAIAAPLSADLGIGNTQIGLLVTLTTGIGALATLPVGMLVDRGTGCICSPGRSWCGPSPWRSADLRAHT